MNLNVNNMKITLNLTWAIFWIGLFTLIIVLSIYSDPTPDQICAKNNGIATRDMWGKFDCKFIKK